MSTNPQKIKRETKQVRLAKDIHLQMRIAAFNERKTLSRLLDEICRQYLGSDNVTNATHVDPADVTNVTDSGQANGTNDTHPE